MQLDKSARSEALRAINGLAKPVRPKCVICRTLALSTGGKLREEWVNHEVHRKRLRNCKMNSERHMKYGIKIQQCVELQSVLKHNRVKFNFQSLFHNSPA